MKCHPLILISTVLLLFTTAARTQPEPPAGSRDPLPGLDELLGLEEEESSGVDPNKEALRQILSPKEAGEALGQAVHLMNQVAERIESGNDLSIATQRLQEDILRKLDQVIESAKSNQQGQGGGSSSSSSSSSSSQQQPNQQQQEQGQQGQPGTESGEPSVPGGTSNANPGDAIAPDGVAWGALPKRIRDALSQGISDRYSELYRSITEEYYRALAEDEDQ